MLRRLSELLIYIGHGEPDRMRPTSQIFNRRQVIANILPFLLAGHEMTINLICRDTLSFIRHPEQRKKFKRNPMKPMKSATKECLRYDSPAKSITRITMQAVKLQGKILPKDARLRWITSSANNDPEKFPKADVFDIERYPNLHITLGSSIHHFLDATLARLEGKEAFRALAACFDRLELQTETLEYHPRITCRSLTSMPVTWN